MPSRTLREWEERLRPEIEEVDLLGEIRLSQEESRELGRLIGDLVRDLGWRKAEEVLREEYPCSFAVFLVSQGVHFYEGGDYWSAIRGNTELPLSPAQTIQWGELFLQIVRDLDVAQFPDLGGHRFVGPILAHGGIPDYCLADFFERIIRPLVSRPEYTALSTTEFLAERLNLPSISALVDTPVLRFLRFGGSVAEDFVERCRELALRTAEKGVPPAPEAVGLPSRIVEAYSEWLEGKVRISSGRRRIFRSPVLFLDPWGCGVCVHCPRQPILAADAQARVLWRIWADGELQAEIPVEVRQEEFDLKSEEESIPLRRPAGEYRVELVFAREGDKGLRDEVQRVWRLPGISQGRPLLLFDRENGRVVTAEDVIPAGSFWILHPPDVELVAEPEGSLLIRERLPRLSWEWSDFIGETIDLSQVSRLGIVRGGVEVTQFSVVSAGLTAQPILEGGQVLDVRDGRPPLYLGSPPALKFPFLTPESRLRRWHVEVRNEWPARPNVHVSQTLDSLRGEIDLREKHALLDLTKYLGDATMGNYRVSVRGPLGHRADLSFRILPRFDVVGHEDLYFPGVPQKRATLLVETPTDCTLQVPRSAKGCEIRTLEESERSHLYEVTAGPAVGSIPLRVVGVNEADEPVYVSLTVSLRRLRWMIVLRPEEALAPQWRTMPIRLPLQALEQSAEPYVFVDLFGGALESLSVELHLEDEEGSSIQEQTAKYRARQRYVRFDLRPLLDTLRHTEASRFTLRLVLQGLPGCCEPFETPIAWITKRFVVEQASAEAVWDAQSVVVTLRWQAVTRTRHRLARLWPLWRPWEPPLEVQIPDEARGEHRFTVPASRLMPSKYSLEFDVRDPWTAAPSVPSRPAADAEGAFPICIPSDAAEQRLDHLARLEAQGDLSFADVLERACILRDLGREKAAHADFQWCFEHLDDAEIEHVLALAHCVSSDPSLDLPLRLKMAAAHRVERLLRAYYDGDVPERLFRKYLRLLPRHTLLPAETCKLLLSVDDERLRIHAAEQLLRRRQPSGVRAVIEWVKAGEMSDEDALSLLKEQIDLAIDVMQEALPHAAVLRLLEKLGKQYPERVPVVVVRPGHWIHCIAGWGRIERIETSEGEETSQFFYQEQTYRLHVLLRAQNPQEAEPVVIDLAEGTITFQEAEKVYTCVKCGRFSSSDPDRVCRRHERAAHEGVGPRYRIVRGAVLRQQEPLEYAFLPPENPWV